MRSDGRNDGDLQLWKTDYLELARPMHSGHTSKRAIEEKMKTILEVGDEGYIYRFRGTGPMRRLKFSIYKQVSSRYITTACIKTGKIPAGDITTRSLDPIVARLSSSMLL